MNIGMLWFDNDPKTGLDTKVERAAVYYRNKYGRTPTLCYVHPSMIPASGALPKNGHGPDDSGNGKENYVTGGVEVRSTQSVLPNHLWIGLNGASEKEKAQL
jgi:hypothetical protein